MPLAPARDFKRAHDGDNGPNTGGMGAYSPPLGVDNALVAEVVDTVLRPAVRELAASGDEFRGVLYAGLMLTKSGIRAIEFNARFGDPEAQAVLPRLQSDLVALALASSKGTLASFPDLIWSPQASVAIVVASAHYPDDAAMTLGLQIRGLAEIPRGALIFHAGTKFEPGKGLVTDGGRVVTSAALGETVAQAREKALAGARRVRFPGGLPSEPILLRGGYLVNAVVGVILGSKSDLPLMESCVKVLEELGLAHEVMVCSAHRNPRGVMEWATSARGRGIKVVIAAAGGAAHLPGVVAAWTDLPVIGVPVPTQHLGGVDSLYSIVQMPAGIPVATVAIGEGGAKNAAWLAARIIGLSDTAVEARHGEKRAALAGP